MSFSSLPVHLDPPNWKQLPAAAGAGAGRDGGETGLASAQAPPGVAAAGPTISMAERARLGKVPPPEQALQCPRCDSTNTKFCYFNNYSFSQPRHFCKACRRYWTRGGALRSVPVGGACRRRRDSSAKSSSSPSKPSNLAPRSRGIIPMINAAAAAAGRRIELWKLPQIQHLPFLELAAQRPATLTAGLPHFQDAVNLEPVKMEDHASRLGFISPIQYSAPPGNYHQQCWSSSDGIKDGGGSDGGGWVTTADLYVFDSSSISGYDNNYS
ncbi:uncharacterized protein LOC121973725 [Zingiber officinale]|uniref:Dof zinc finger protein n=1 Tax=Zingiber officinale TaxID=94328 RepID=A0A8J5HE90_ZINOF|nr:uncharacterized protein LOC121973725 [Zingiber officinale]KAG6515964.1 hypothetical protein ZIOFF_026410 [Zingiber officinale]